jgi:hypothetical protein
MEARPLPPDWTSQYDDREQRLFFINTLTQYRTWEDPRPAYYAQMEQQQQGYQQNYPSYPPPPPQQYQPPPPQQQYQPQPPYQNNPNMPEDIPEPPSYRNYNSGLSEETVYNNSLSEKVVYNNGLSEETVYISQNQEESYSSGIGVGGAIAIAAGAGLVGALAGGLVANHHNHKNDNKYKQ